MKRSLI